MTLVSSSPSQYCSHFFTLSRFPFLHLPVRVASPAAEFCSTDGKDLSVAETCTAGGKGG